MLLGKDGGGTEHANLKAVGSHLAGRPHGHFGFAETDVSANQPIDHFFRFQVLQHFPDGTFLVFGFPVGEAVGECSGHFVLGGERGTGLHFPFGVKPDQFGSHLAYVFPHFRFRFLPFSLAESGQGRSARIGRGVFLDQVDGIDGNENFIFVPEVKHDEFVALSGNLDVFQSLVDSDSVLDCTT